MLFYINQRVAPVPLKAPQPRDRGHRGNGRLERSLLDVPSSPQVAGECTRSLEITASFYAIGSHSSVNTDARLAAIIEAIATKRSRLIGISSSILIGFVQSGCVFKPPRVRGLTSARSLLPPTLDRHTPD
jgi:hypothetical protein